MKQNQGSGLYLFKCQLCCLSRNSGAAAIVLLVISCLAIPASYFISLHGDEFTCSYLSNVSDCRLVVKSYRLRAIMLLQVVTSPIPFLVALIAGIVKKKRDVIFFCLVVLSTCFSLHVLVQLIIAASTLWINGLWLPEAELVMGLMIVFYTACLAKLWRNYNVAIASPSSKTSIYKPAPTSAQNSAYTGAVEKSKPNFSSSVFVDLARSEMSETSAHKQTRAMFNSL